MAAEFENNDIQNDLLADIDNTVDKGSTNIDNDSTTKGILEIKATNDIDPDLLKMIDVFNLPNVNASLKGSSQYKYMNYTSDYDLISFVERKTPVGELFIALQKVLQKIEQHTDMYFIELKYLTANDLKERLHPGDVFGIALMERHYSQLKFIKIDTVIRVKERFYELTCIYSFKEEIKTSTNEVIKQLNEDIEEYKKEGNYFKILKRLFSIAVMNNNIGAADYFIKIFNSELGKLYEIYCNLKAIELLHKYYTDSTTIDKINKNLKLIDDKFSLKGIAKHIGQYFKKINSAAKKLYENRNKI